MKQTSKKMQEETTENVVEFSGGGVKEPKPHVQTLVELLEVAGFRLLSFSRNTKILVDEEVKLQEVPQKRVVYQIMIRPPHGDLSLL